MSTLRTDRIRILTAPVGEENPLPPLFGTGNSGYSVDMSDAPDEIRRNAEYGRVESIAPYLFQDGYGRIRAEAEHPVAILENAHLRATFLLGVGGRLWSLVHVPTGRELLFRNAVLQPANLALRNAWFSGGIEWNVGTIGHSPGTFSPVHAAAVDLDDGSRALRLWEFDRIRRMTYQIDAHLPQDSQALYVHGRIVNGSTEDRPSYWWSNIAVPQTDRTRVIVPAESAWAYAYSQRLEAVPIIDEGARVDVSYPGRSLDAADYFFDVADEPTPWIVAVDDDGVGLAQRSSGELRGRKLFLWGRGVGGERWQEWLNGPGQSYIEIQAGLARTQFEHLPVPARGERRWVEAYGRADLAPENAHGAWTDARDAAARAVERMAPRDDLAAARASDLPSRPVSETLHQGSGWGALDRFLRGGGSWDAPLDPATPYPNSSVAEEQEEWIALHRSGTFPHTDPTSFPRSLEIAEEWEDVLAEGKGWVEPALLGNLLAARGDRDGAKASWLLSVRRAPNVLALRNLAALAAHLGHLDEAVDRYEQALALNPTMRQLVVEALGVLLDASRAERALEIVRALPEPTRSDPRVLYAEARACISTGDLSRAASILEGGLEIADLREGEVSLHETWWDLRTAMVARSGDIGQEEALRDHIVRTEAVPRDLDFRMTRDRRIRTSPGRCNRHDA
ncbi:DUF5107 domain-containing protein [Microbacterium hydrocarbonoxydans]|uniref:DUF5107 domain-containing protein n=1 Tax=Microbacterium hydrocarbonoxydans TaxID=273678 RepID=UPI00203DD274|nr:DUF5107 domain-containing protein [Microbacterium hydrocarbonoxydans]MCM3778244.1 DUF5107 domain-containing protein [Microbacterium hydrocarbonoxydans]